MSHGSNGSVSECNFVCHLQWQWQSIINIIIIWCSLQRKFLKSHKSNGTTNNFANFISYCLPSFLIGTLTMCELYGEFDGFKFIIAIFLWIFFFFLVAHRWFFFRVSLQNSIAIKQSDLNPSSCLRKKKNKRGKAKMVMKEFIIFRLH